ncbi:gamma-glutamyl-gamma-aminobutyrate hydrolase family protein [Bacillaceae bacterium IKA-2]|nr:gamma-glutamyl-gamma-aminobutyrate hydrolase family protein [Bacillaceae bacterium IKA-2]
MILQTKPIIGISSSFEKHNNTPSVHLHEKYVRAVIAGGGIPIVIPIVTGEMVERLVTMCDGIILSGGEDIDPVSYQANPIPQLQKTNLKRDKIEIELINHGFKKQKPILAICRGLPMLNVAFGGTVIQDIQTSIQNSINHFQQAERPEATHDIQIDVGSRFYQIFQMSKIRVNSMHHQAIGVLAPSLKIVATAPDGVIEAVEGINEASLIWGVQWHPEEMAEENSSMDRLFKEFVAECIYKLQ